MSRQHVLHVVPGLGPGGMEMGMARVISGLNGGHMRHSVVCLKGEPKIADRLPAAVDIHCMHSRPNEPHLPVRLARLIRQIRPNVIHARNWGAWPDTAVARLFTRFQAHLVLSFHGLGRADYMPLRRRCASWLFARMSTSLVTVSNESKELMAAKWGWPRSRVKVIPNGVDTDRFSPAAPRPPDRQRIVVGTVGNLRPVKNHPLLVSACADLAQADFDLELRIAGDGEERENLLAFAAANGFAGRLKLAGRVEDVPRFLRDLDVFVLSSDSEQHPNALNEAMACGIACVATRVGCVSELLDAGRCGRIVPAGDRQAMAAAIRDLLVNPATRRTLGSAARQRACEHYSLATMLAAYDELYCTLSSVGGRKNS